MEHLIMEEELELQLNLLKAETPDPSLFPEVEEKMAELPHLKDDTVSKKAEDFVHQAELVALEQESILDEETLEAAAICLVIAGLLFLPQLVHL